MAALDYAKTDDERAAIALIAGPGARLTGRFGPRAQVPGTKSRPHHDGIDIAGAVVGDKVLMYAPRDFQTVLYSGKDSYGALDLFLGTKQDGLRLVHNSEHAVTKGPIARGQTVARMGATGNVNGVHTHLERYEGGRVVDPLPWLISLLDQKNSNPSPDTPATTEEDDVALTKDQNDNLDWLDHDRRAKFDTLLYLLPKLEKLLARVGTIDLAGFQVGDLWQRRAVIDRLGSTKQQPASTAEVVDVDELAKALADSLDDKLAEKVADVLSKRLAS